MYLDEIRLNSEQHNDVIVLSQKCQNHKAQLKHGYDALYCTSYLVQWRPEMSKELRIEESGCLACPITNAVNKLKKNQKNLENRENLKKN